MHWLVPLARPLEVIMQIKTCTQQQKHTRTGRMDSSITAEGITHHWALLVCDDSFMPEIFVKMIQCTRTIINLVTKTQHWHRWWPGTDSAPGHLLCLFKCVRKYLHHPLKCSLVHLPHLWNISLAAFSRKQFNRSPFISTPSVQADCWICKWIKSQFSNVCKQHWEKFMPPCYFVRSMLCSDKGLLSRKGSVWPKLAEFSADLHLGCNMAMTPNINKE